MSASDKDMQGVEAGVAELTLREAAATVLVASVAADGTLTREEGVRLHSLLSSMRLFRDVRAAHVQHLIEAAVDAVARSRAEALLPACAAGIPDDLRTPLFALAVELVFAHSEVAEREKQFIDTLQAAFALDDTTALRIISVIFAKSRA